MGTPEYARVILKSLQEAEDIHISLVLTQPDRPVGRKRILTPSAVKVFATEKEIKVFQPDNVNEPNSIARLEEEEADFIVVAAYGQILSRRILDIAPCINLHASLLPAYRGASPVQQALLNGDSMSGVTAMFMEEGLDSGPVLAYSFVPVPEKIRSHELLKLLGEAAAELAPEVLHRYESLMHLPQFSAVASYCRKIRRSDGEVDLKSAEEIYRKYRAFEGWPGVFLPNGLKLLEMELMEKDGKNEPGVIIDTDGEYVMVGCQEGVLRIHVVQPSSKKAMSAGAYLLGKGLKVGDYIL